MSQANPIDTPMEAKLNIQSTTSGSENTLFSQLIGSLLFIARISRPDISYPVNYLSRFHGKVTPEILGYARRIIQYLNSSKDVSLVYASSSEECIAHVDASFAPDLGNPKSVTGYLIYHFGNLISWGTKRQTLVTVSSTAAEYIAISDIVPELMLIKYLNQEVFAIHHPIKVMEDNISTYQIAESGERRRLRHTIIKQHAVLEAVEDHEIKIEHIEGKRQPADGMTKQLDSIKYKEFCKFIFS